jgi:predicted alpha/beta hydrolase family esterase
MNPQKNVFIIPGFFSSTKNSEYTTIGNQFQKKGYHVVYVNITWEYRRISDWIEQFKSTYIKNKGSYNIVLGFSYGATVAYLACQTVTPDQLYLCSIVAYFLEDLPLIPQAEILDIGKRRYQDIRNCSFDSVAQKVQCKTSLFYGANEQSFIKRRSNIAVKMLSNAKLVEIPNIGHQIAHPLYLEAINREVSRLE